MNKFLSGFSGSSRNAPENERRFSENKGKILKARAIIQWQRVRVEPSNGADGRGEERCEPGCLMNLSRVLLKMLVVESLEEPQDRVIYESADLPSTTA